MKMKENPPENGAQTDGKKGRRIFVLGGKERGKSTKIQGAPKAVSHNHPGRWVTRMGTCQSLAINQKGGAISAKGRVPLGRSGRSDPKILRVRQGRGGGGRGTKCFWGDQGMARILRPKFCGFVSEGACGVVKNTELSNVQKLE